MVGLLNSVRSVRGAELRTNVADISGSLCKCSSSSLEFVTYATHGFLGAFLVFAFLPWAYATGISSPRYMNPARVTQHLHDSLGSPGVFQNASILAFVSPRFCLQSLSFVILRRLPFARRPISPPSSLVVPHSFSIPSIVRNLGKFSNPFLFWSFSIVDFS